MMKLLTLSALGGIAVGMLLRGVMDPLAGIDLSDLDDDERVFAERVLRAGRRACDIRGLHPAVLVAQAALESGWGRSQAMVACNALWGIKVGSYTPEEALERADRQRREFGLVVQPFYSTNWRTHEYRNGQRTAESAQFRCYQRLQDGAVDYVDLVTRGRYEPVVRTQDPFGQVARIWAAGYATSPSYVRNVFGILERLGVGRRPGWTERVIERVLEGRAAGRSGSDLISLVP